MKKGLVLFLMILVVGTVSVFAEKPADGVYFAQETEFPKSGWKYNVTLVVKRGKIKEVVWDGSNINAGMAKDAVSRAGKYGMEANGGAMAPWWKQAEAVEKALIKAQDINAITLSDDAGHTDAVSGATIKVGNFVDLVKEALAAGPVGYGPYKDGTYRAEADEFGNGWKYFVDVTVTSGYIVSVSWDAMPEKGGKNKKQTSIDGEYGMVEKGGAMAPWFEQARAVEKQIIMTQDVSKVDSISGASVGLDPFYTLLNKALSGAKR
ncbi:MAG: FMN-binding protein [Spirochaetales bacterium]|nr:FMN-binding protein [Spirochaetales bacterium]